MYSMFCVTSCSLKTKAVKHSDKCIIWVWFGGVKNSRFENNLGINKKWFGSTRMKKNQNKNRKNRRKKKNIIFSR